LFAALVACQPSGPDAPFHAQLIALRAVFPAAPADDAAGRPHPPPPADALQLPIAANGLQGVDILALRGCAVQRNIVRRDTSLGRMARPSQQLLLTLEYLRLAPPCIRRLRVDNRALADALHRAWRRQRAQLPALIFNATLGGDQYHALRRAAPLPGHYPRVATCDTASALQAIEAMVHRWLAGDYRARERDLELWLAAVAGGAGGEWWPSVASLEARLDAVLPPSYRRWMAVRDQRLETLVAAAPSTRQARVQSCAVPKATEIGYTASTPASTGPLSRTRQ